MDRLLSALLLLALAACSAAEPAPAPPDLTVYRDHGWSALDAGRPRDAIKHFQQILGQIEADPGAQLGLGEAHLALGEDAAALAQFRLLADAKEASLRARALQGSGMALLRQGHFTTARAELEQAVALDLTLWRAWNGLGRIHDGEQAWSAAQSAYRRAIRLQPDEALLHNNLGFSLIAAGELAAAETALNRALTLAPDLAAAETNLRLALALQGRYRLAVAGGARAGRAAAYNNVGYIALLRGDHEQARGLFLQAMEASPTYFDEARRNLAVLTGIEAPPRPIRVVR